MPKLKKSLLLMLFLALSLLFSGNRVQAVSDNLEDNGEQAVSGNSEGNHEQAVSGNSDSEDAQGEADTPESKVIRLACPTEYPFFVARNPEKTTAHLNSQIFYIANYSNQDILIDLSNVHLEADENIAYNELSAPLEENYVSDTKDVFAFLKVLAIDPDNVPSPDDLRSGEIPQAGAVPEDGDFILTGENKTTDYKVLLKAANYDENGEFVSFQPESIFSFYIAGSVTPNKDLIWNQGDISIKVIINYSVVPSEEKESPDADAEKSPDADKKEASDTDTEKTLDDGTKQPPVINTEGISDACTVEVPDAASPSGSESEGEDAAQDSGSAEEKVKQGIYNKKEGFADTANPNTR